MATQRQIPGGQFLNATADAERQIPGGPFVNEIEDASTLPGTYRFTVPSRTVTFTVPARTIRFSSGGS